MNIRIEKVAAEHTFELRRRILRPNGPPEAVHYTGDHDEKAFHLAAFRDNEIVGVFSGREAEIPGRRTPDAWRLRGLAVVDSVRRLGVGRKLNDAAIEYAIELGALTVWGFSRPSAVPYWKHLGWSFEAGDFPTDGGLRKLAFYNSEEHSGSSEEAKGDGSMNSVETVDYIFDFINTYGHGDYDGEAVTLIEHLLQSALNAENDLAPPELIIAALLHDFGDLVLRQSGIRNEHIEDTRHEHLGADAVAKLLREPIADIIRLHVVAKRYLARNAGYSDQLSHVSQTSLKLQGGPLSDEEVLTFSEHPSFKNSIRLRHYDDGAKVVGTKTPELEHYRSLVQEWVENGSPQQ